MKKSPKVALVHDFITYYTGAERVLKVFADMFPESPIFTLLYDEKMNDIFPKSRVIPSYIQNYPSFIRDKRKFLLTKFPKAIEQFNFSEYDLVLSSSGAFSKGVITKPGTTHICYCHAPMRYAWDWHQEYLQEHNLKGIKKVLAEMLLHKVRIWDSVSAERVDLFVANSKTTRERIKKYYKKDSIVVFPPVDTERFSEYSNSSTSISSTLLKNKNSDSYFFIVSRLEPYKRIDIPVEVFNKHPDLKLIIAGTGSAEQKLKAAATSPNIKFLGYQDDDAITKLYSDSRAFIFPGEDDFGITAVEAMSCGKPVLAINKGGSRETVVDGKTGILFDKQTGESFEEALNLFLEQEHSFDSTAIRKHAETFNKNSFIDTMYELINKCAD